ncbi:substrate-binding domain-containing protein [Methyloversatilis sp.]|uniref:substrate-binding domain-containing protein n=1 Tax=Methyloversatilis sp. TaxID=2569862 RepID=UPI002736D624|nr:substrate-binding domain-containing protein [Methyloversatilis sp.]MDP2868193.1 substrate-binding domain-containing protein [Methyloversatilis sp.]MDP3454777.1 substrate-binding domain-containing protein [Methyloversatilis sp.]MDP3579056.1 substrate-binding domain-containing protein [Methyloversatilis sp.]
MSEIAVTPPRLGIEWDFGPDAPAGIGRLLSLLAAIEATGSIAGAARQNGLSYRNAWGLINAWQGYFGQTLISTARASGSTLEDFARQLLAVDRDARQSLAAALRTASQPMRALPRHASSGVAGALRIAASHDPLLNDLIRQLRHDGRSATLSTHGSLESLLALAARRCDIAGFHCPIGELGRDIWTLYLAQHGLPRLRLLGFARRRQGLILARGNPRGVRGMSDLMRADLRFVHRQPGAGTRLAFDQLARQAGLDTRALNEGDEEHTHAAVAALIASDEADAGLGLEAFARRLGLEFLPLFEEMYFLALRDSPASRQTLDVLGSLLRQRDWRTRAQDLSGYTLDEAGVGYGVPEAEHLLFGR